MNFIRPSRLLSGKLPMRHNFAGAIPRVRSIPRYVCACTCTPLRQSNVTSYPIPRRRFSPPLKLQLSSVPTLDSLASPFATKNAHRDFHSGNRGGIHSTGDRPCYKKHSKLASSDPSAFWLEQVIQTAYLTESNIYIYIFIRFISQFRRVSCGFSNRPQLPSSQLGFSFSTLGFLSISFQNNTCIDFFQFLKRILILLILSFNVLVFSLWLRRSM